MTTTVMALEPDFWHSIGRGIGAMWLYAAVGLVLMVIGFYAIDLTTPGPLRQMVKQGKPNAVVISAAGIVSMAFIVVLAIYSSGGRLAEGLTRRRDLRLRRDRGTGGHDACRDHGARRQHVRAVWNPSASPTSR